MHQALLSAWISPAAAQRFVIVEIWLAAAGEMTKGRSYYDKKMVTIFYWIALLHH